VQLEFVAVVLQNDAVEQDEEVVGFRGGVVDASRNQIQGDIDHQVLVALDTTASQASLGFTLVHASSGLAARTVKYFDLDVDQVWNFKDEELWRQLVTEPVAIAVHSL